MPATNRGHTKAAAAKKRKLVPGAATTAGTETKAKTPRGTSNSRRGPSPGASNPTSSSSSGAKNSSKAPNRRNRQTGLSRDFCEQIRGKLAKNLLNDPPITNQRCMTLLDHAGKKRQFKYLDKCKLSDTSNFGLPIEQSIHRNGIPVLPDDLEDWQIHLRNVATDSCLPLFSNNDLLSEGVTELAERLEIDTNQKVFVGYKELKSINYEEIIREAKGALTNQTNKLDGFIDAIGVAIGGLAKHVETTSQTVAEQGKQGKTTNKQLQLLTGTVAETNKCVQQIAGTVHEHSRTLEKHERAHEKHERENNDRKRENLELSARFNTVEQTILSLSAKKPTFHSQFSTTPVARRQLFHSPQILEEDQIPEEENIISEPGINFLATPQVGGHPSYGTVQLPRSDSKPAAKPSFDLQRALLEKLKHFVSDAKKGRSGQHADKLNAMTDLLERFCPQITIRNGYIDGNKRLKVDISDIKKQQELASAGKLLLEIDGTVDLQSIGVDDVTEEDEEQTLFLPRVHGVRPRSDIAHLLPRLFEHNDPNASIIYDLIICADDEASFIIHRDVLDVDLEDENSPVYHGNRYEAVLNAEYITEALDCVVHYNIQASLDDGKKAVGLTVSVRADNNDASDLSPLAKIMNQLVEMENVSTIILISPAQQNEHEPMPFNSGALKKVLTSGKCVKFEKISMKHEQLIEATGPLEFQSCCFYNNVFYKRVSFHRETVPVPVTFSHLNDACLPEPVKFLETIVDGVDQNKIIQVYFNEWECTKTNSDEIIMKLAELSRKLPGGLCSGKEPPKLSLEDKQSQCLCLKGITFHVPYMRQGMNVRKLIEELNRLHNIPVENFLPPKNVGLSTEFDFHELAKNIQEGIAGDEISLDAIKISLRKVITRAWK